MTPLARHAAVCAPQAEHVVIAASLSDPPAVSAQGVPVIARHRVSAWGLFLASALMLGAAVPAEAQRNCRKGIACGNSCISASKVCRVGPAPSAPAPRISSSPTGTSSSGTRPTCRTGIPCGRSCIAATKVCRLDSAPRSANGASSTQPRDERGRFIRSSSARARFMRQTGYVGGRPGYVVDHVIALACGGSDSPENMQWQTIAEARAKDRLERRGCRR